MYSVSIRAVFEVKDLYATSQTVASGSRVELITELVAPVTVQGAIGDAKCGFSNSLILLAFSIKRSWRASSKSVTVADCSNCAQSKYWYSSLDPSFCYVATKIFLHRFSPRSETREACVDECAVLWASRVPAH